MNPDFASAASDVAAAPPPQADKPVDDANNAFHDAAQSVADDARTQLRTNMVDAQKTNPDEFAKAKRIGEPFGVPPALVDDHVEALSQARNADHLLNTSPKLAEQFQLPDFANLAHDDVPALSALEKETDTSDFPDTTLDEKILKLPYSTLQGLGLQFNKASTGLNMALGGALLTTGAPRLVTDWWFNHFVDPGLAQREALERPEGEGMFAEKAFHTVGSLLGMLSMMELSGTGGAPSVLAPAAKTGEVLSAATEKAFKTMLLPALSEAVDTSRRVYELTGDPNAAMKAGQTSYITTTATGLMPLSAPGSLAARTLVYGPVAGAVMGEASRVANNFAMPDNMQHGFDWQEFALSGLAGSILAIGGPKAEPSGAYDAIRRVYVEAAKADRAERDLPTLQNISKLSAASSLRERDPDSFKQFVNTLTEDGKLANVYVNVDTLGAAFEQAGITPAEVQAKMPDVAAQINEAMQTHGDVRIPTADYATHISGTPADAVLLEHLKTSPDGMTYAEAKTYEQEQKASLQQQAETILASAQTDKDFKDSAAKVEANLLAQLNAADRFSPDVNSQYARLASAMYTTQASRLGLTPEQMYEQFPLNIRADALEGAQSMEQPMSARIQLAFEAMKSTPEQWPGQAGVADMIKRGIAAFRLSGQPQVFRSARGIGDANTQTIQDAVAGTAGRDAAIHRQQPTADNGGSSAGNAGVAEAKSLAGVAAGSEPNLVGLPVGPMQIAGQWYVPGANAIARSAAVDYMQRTGQPYLPVRTFQRVDPARGKRIADAFDEMKHDPTNPEVAAAYDALAKETIAQWQTIKQTGLKVEFIKAGQEDPYKTSPRQAIEDVVRNNHLWVFPTEGGFGPNLVNIGLDIPGGGKLDPAVALDALKNAGVTMSKVLQSKSEPTLVAQLQRPLSADEAHLISLALKQESIAQLSGGVGQLHGPSAAKWGPFNPEFFFTLNGKTAKEEGLSTEGNPLLQRAGEVIDGRDAVVNDVFRIVHDYFGHIKDGIGFRADGEENAWRSHSAMYSDLARRAMTTETRGQNSWVNFGPHGETNKTASAADTQYAAQKIGLLPEWASEEGRRDPPEYEQRVVRQIDTQEFKKWFGNSKVVDARGKPLVVYHGTNKVFNEFDGSKSGTRNVDMDSGDVFFFTDNATAASDYAVGSAQFSNPNAPKKVTEGANVVPVYLSMKNPLVWDFAKGNPSMPVMKDRVEAGSDDTTYLSEMVPVAKANGFDGVIALNTDDGGPQRIDQYAVFKPTQIKSAIGNVGTFDPNDPNIMHQDARGKITFGDSGASIALLKSADLSTFTHELGHFYLELLQKMAEVPNAPPEITDDLNELLRWFNVNDKPTWDAMSTDEKRPHHEQFATAFEKYLFEGKAPSQELASLFGRMRAWMISVYKSITGLGVELTPEVRGVFDRMLASDAQIKQAEASRGMFALFKEKPEGMTDEQWQNYLQGNQQATADAVSEVQRKSLRDMQWLSNAKSKSMRDLQKQADAERDVIRTEVTKEVDQQDIYRAELWLRKGETIAPNGDLVKAEKGFKLDADKVAELYPETMLARPDIGRLQGMTSKSGGLDPQTVAEMYGFSSGDKLIRALIDMQPKDEVIRGMTDQRMLERHGEMSDPVAIERTAEAAIHNPVRARMIATELKGISKSLLPARALAKGATEAAEAAIAKRQVKDLNPGQHEAAEARAAKVAQAAMAKADTVATVAAKRAQLLNNRLAKAAQTALDDVQKGLTYFAKFAKPGVRENIDVAFRDQIDALLSRFDLRKSLTPAQAADKRTQSLDAFVEKLSAMKFNLDIPQSLLNEANRQHYKDMTVEEFRGLTDSIKAIEHLGRTMQKVTDGKEMRLLADVAQEAADKAALLPQRKSETNRGLSAMATKWMQTKSLMRSVSGSLIKMEQMVDWMDARNSNGVFNRMTFRKIADAEGVRNELDLKITKQWEAAIRAMPKNLLKDNRGIIEMPGVIDGLTGETQRLSWSEKMQLAMIRGDASHFAKLLKGEKWDTAAVLQFLDQNVSKPEWDFLHAISKTFGELEPLKHAMLRELGGTAPKSVAHIPFQTPHGEYPGWYVPISYDPARSREVELRNARHEASLFEDNIFNRADTSTGREITRNENYAKPMLLSLDALPRVLKDEIRDITTRKAIIEADRFLSHPLVRESISNVLSKEHYNQFNGWLLSLANDAAIKPSELQMWDSLAHGLRTRATMVGLGLRLSTIIQHGLTAAGESVAEAGPKAMFKGTFNTKTLAGLTSLGPEWLNKGIDSFARSAQFEANRDFIFDHSTEMKHRSNEIERDVREQLREIKLKLASPATGAIMRAKLGIQAHAYSGIAMIDMASAMPTWMGAYLKGLESTARGGLGMNEADAVYFADKTVRNAHGGGGVKDMAAVQRGGEFMKLFTMFYTFWNHNINRIIDTGKRAAELPATVRSGDYSKAASDASIVMMRTMMYTLGVQAIHMMMHPPKKDDGTEGWLAWFGKAMAMAVTGGIPGVRDIAAHYLEGRDYEVSPIKSVVDSGDALLKDVEGKSHTDQYIKHALSTAGYVFGLPLGQVGATSQFLSDVWNGKQNPRDIAEWWHGVSTGKSR